MPSVRRIFYYATVSFDGYFSGPDGDLQRFVPSEQEHQCANDLLREADELLEGRVMHEVMSYWDGVDPTDLSTARVEREFASIYQSKHRYVFSTTLTSADERTTVWDSDIFGRVAQLKNQAGGYLGLGCGPALLAQFLQRDLVDEVRLLVMPLLLGEGVPLFGAVTETRSLKLEASQTFDSGSVLLSYQSA